MDPIKKLKKVNYVPVTAFAVLEAIYAEKYIYKGKQLSFATEDSIFKYDKCLVNPVHCKKLYHNCKPKFREDVIIFSDSGGLQELTMKKGGLDSQEVVKWQEENSHIGFSLDSIPLVFKDRADGGIGSELFFDSKNFLTHAEKSAENIYKANQVRTNPNFKFYAIIQGIDNITYRQWYKILKNEKVDGYCLKSVNTHPISIADSCLFAYFNLDKPIHFLGVENFSRSVICTYFSKYYKHPISFDGSSWSMGCRLRSYRLPFSSSSSIQILSDAKEEEKEQGEDGEEVQALVGLDTFDFCSCPACTIIDSIPELQKDIRLGLLLSLHNLYQVILRTNLLQKMISNRSLLNKFVRSSVGSSMAERILLGFDFIDYAVEHGYDMAKEKYRFQLCPAKESTRQTSIFDV